MRAPRKVGSSKKYPTRSVSVSYNPKADQMHNVQYKIERCLNDRQKELLARTKVVKSAILVLSKIVEFDVDEAVKNWVGKPTQDFLASLDS